MPEYGLQPNEYVVLKSERVLHGGAMAGYGAGLVLTNQNIVLISKGFFRNTKGIRYFPLGQIKNFDGRPQAIASGQKLEVYFLNGQESFGFESKREVKAWADNISKLLTGSSEDLSSAPGKAIPGAAYAAETLKGTVDTFKHAFGMKSGSPNPEKCARKCTSCGASISGVIGRVVRCPYCDSDQQL